MESLLKSVSKSSRELLLPPSKDLSYADNQNNPRPVIYTSLKELNKIRSRFCVLHFSVVVMSHGFHPLKMVVRAFSFIERSFSRGGAFFRSLVFILTPIPKPHRFPRKNSLSGVFFCYLRNPSSEMVFLYASKSLFSRYFSNFLRFPTICISPRFAM